MGIVDILQVGKENALTRAELCDMMKVTDRAVRLMIAEARAEGAIIINAQDGKGYYLSEDPADLRRQYNSNRRRALSILRQQKFLRRKLEAEENKEQLVLDIRESGCRCE